MRFFSFTGSINNHTPLGSLCGVEYPAVAKLLVVISQDIGSVPGEKWVYDFVADWNQEFGEEIFEVFEVRGKSGIGLDLGHVNKFRDGSERPVPASVVLVGKPLKTRSQGHTPSR